MASSDTQAPTHWCDSIEFELIGTDSYHHRHDDHGKIISLRDLRLGAGECEPTEEEIEHAEVFITIDGAIEIRNWSFGFEGRTMRTTLSVSTTAGRVQAKIVLQRAGPGGRVPVTHKPEVEYGDGVITYGSPGSWRVREPGGRVPSSYSWKQRPEEVSGSLQPTFGRPRPLLVDYDVLRSWMRLCGDEHDICKHQGNPVNIPRLRLVDVKNMCIVEFVGQERPPFATLSYVWGSRPFLRLARENLANLRKPGALRTTLPPLTISDAILICDGLRIRYLWVDSLCIIQNDEADMMETIDKMDVIYRESVLTIVAATGEGAHCGIHGVRPGTRSLEQRSLEKRGVQLIDSVDHNQFRMQTKFTEPEWISGTPWAQRAWTFQEALVSRRVLFFTSEQVYWSCREGLLSEDTTEHFSSEANLVSDGIRFDAEFDPLEYQRIAVTFSTRRLTFEADMGRAYLGTQSYLDKKWGGHDFSWGLPHGAFGSFLVWQWGFQKGRRMRRGTHPVRQPDGSVVKVPFPSWSWMGWIEGGQLIDFYGDEPSPHSPSFFVIDASAGLAGVHDGLNWRSQPKPLADLLKADSDSSETSPDLTTTVTESDLPVQLLSTHSIRHSALVFFTETVRVRYDPSAGFEASSRIDEPNDLQMMSQTYPFSIMIKDKFYRIIEEDQTDSSENRRLEEIELVAVFAGQMTKPKKLRGQYRLYCWPVTKQDGIRVRASYMNTIIFLSLWKILPQRKWELVTMV
ncbi:heterokaryon incompatibility protein-domain-containing protein [Dactylonectria estremocensis]|uniref:Heterokaryon incompatibility protein-domain-containing protein n=1 Tax=Dactylonectria estremocensis TaxID=1079267 RepID=A0A9P9JBR1_9HYPO|nr:heterokaryon incompatibility protein-domain-containing protein [Dactylonectria estremocensis]